MASSFVTYKHGIMILSPAPTADGVVGIMDNFVAIGDFLDTVVTTASLSSYVTTTALTTALSPYATSSSVTSLLTNYLPLSGGSISGSLTIGNAIRFANGSYICADSTSGINFYDADGNVMNLNGQAGPGITYNGIAVYLQQG